jgi:hypothetical protein
MACDQAIDGDLQINDRSEHAALEALTRELGEEAFDRSTSPRPQHPGSTRVDPKPFVWTADPKRVLAAVKRGKQTLESVH